ncbi:MAG: hypothetical protein SGILL_007114, partial [Bacillariaceae sp.]
MALESDSDDSFMAEFKADQAKRNIRASRSSKASKKAKRDETVKGLLDSALKSGEEKMHQETRMGEIQKKSNELQSPEAVEKLRSASKINDTENDAAKTLFSSSAAEHLEPVDIKATTCLGARDTLQLRRLLDETDSEGNPHPVTRCSWSNLTDASHDFTNAVKWELEQSQQNDNKNPLIPADHFDWYRHELLDRSFSEAYFAFNLRETWLCFQDSKFTHELPASILHWLFAMACTPITMKIKDGSNKRRKLADPKNMFVDATLLSAKQGAYKTL